MKLYFRAFGIGHLWYVRGLCHEYVTETRIKYTVTARDQSAHRPLFSLDPTLGLLSLWVFNAGVCDYFIYTGNVVYVAIELSHSPWYFVYLDSRREIDGEVASNK